MLAKAFVLGVHVITSSYVQDVVVLGQGHSEGLSFDDTVETKFFPLVDRVDSNDVAQFFNDVRHYGGRLGVDHTLSAARKSGF